MEASDSLLQKKNKIFFVLYLTHPHCFRHTFATRCFEAGIVPKTVQAYLGHASLQMTMDLYTAVMEHKKVNDMQLLEDSIDLPDPAAEINLASNEKVIKFCG